MTTKCRYEHFCFRNGCDGIDCMAQDANRVNDARCRVNFANTDPFSAKCVPTYHKYNISTVAVEGVAEFIPVENADYDYNRLGLRRKKVAA